MCWSANGSLATWAAAMALAGGSYGYDPKLWAFMVVYTQIQLVEYFLWKNIKTPRLNALGSKAAALILIIEPIAAIYLIKDVALRNKMLAGYALYIASLLATQSFDWRTTVGGNGHLRWEWLPSWGLIVPWILFLVVPFLISGYYKSFAVAIVTLLISIYFFSKYGTVSSMWCWTAIIGLFFMFLNALGTTSR